MNENPIAGWPQKKDEYETFVAITNFITHIATNTNEFGLSPITAMRPSLLPDPFVMTFPSRCLHLEMSEVKFACLRLEDLWVEQIHRLHTLEEECLVCRG
jgi:hypothetical protein